MKDKLYNIFTLSMTLILIGCYIYFGVFERIEWVKNIFIFYTWFTFAARFMLVVVPNDNEGKVKYYSTYKDGKHFPLWFDYILYPTMIVILASQAFWFTAIAWTFTMFFDFSTRELSNKHFTKLQEESENNA